MDFRGDLFSDNSSDSNDSDNDSDFPNRMQRSSALLSAINPVSKNLFGAKRKTKDYFHKAELVSQGIYYAKAPPLPPRAFVYESVTFNLS